MRDTRNKLWTTFFIAVVLFPVAGVVSGLIGTQSGLTFWIMGIAAYQPMLSVTNLSFRRRLAIWLTALTVGGVTTGLGTIAIGLLMQIAAPYALTASGRVTSVFQLVVAIRMAIRWAPVPMAWVVSTVLVRRLSRRSQVASASAATRQSTQDLKTQMTVTGDVQNEGRAQKDGASVGSRRARATALNHPLKRLAFALFIISAASFAGLVMLPVPFSTRAYLDWEDATAAQSQDRQITRLDTRCAGRLSGGVETFARDFSILDAVNDEFAGAIFRLYSREKATIADKVDLTTEDRVSFLSQLSGGRIPCFENVCVNTLTQSGFENVLKSCGVLVGQHRHEGTDVTWHLVKNFEDHTPWSTAVFVSSVVFLLMSLLYDKTLGVIVRWIREG